MATATAPPPRIGLDRCEDWLRDAHAHPWRWLMALALLLAIQISPWWYPTPDGCSYLSIARSIAHGGPPQNLGSRRLWYSPGYPVLISPAFLFGDRPFLALSAANFLFAAGALVGAYHWARRAAPEAALLVAALAVVNLGVWLHMHRTLSETAFMCWLFWSAAAANALLARLSARHALLWGAGLGLLIAGLCLIRQAGLAVAAGFSVAAGIRALRREVVWRRAAALVAMVCALPTAALVAVMVYEAHFAANERSITYLDHFGHLKAGFAAQLLEGLRLRISDVGQVAVPGMLKSYAPAHTWLDINMILYCALFVVLAIGWWKMVRAGLDALALGLPFYLLLYVLWGFESGARFLVPLVGACMACLWFVVHSAARRPRCMMCLFLIAHAAVATGYWLAVEVPRGSAINRQWAAIDQLAATIAPAGAPVAMLGGTENDRWLLALALDRRVPLVDDLRQLPAEIDFVVAPSRTGKWRGYHVARQAGSWKLFARDAAEANLARRPASP